MEGIIDRQHPHGVIFGYGKYDEPVIKPDVIPFQPQYFAPPHAGSQGEHDHIPERMRRGQAAG